MAKGIRRALTARCGNLLGGKRGGEASGSDQGAVLAGLVPAIHADVRRSILPDRPDPNRVDGRDKPGHDNSGRLGARCEAPQRAVAETIDAGAGEGVVLSGAVAARCFPMSQDRWTQNERQYFQISCFQVAMDIKSKRKSLCKLRGVWTVLALQPTRTALERIFSRPTKTGNTSYPRNYVQQ